MESDRSLLEINKSETDKIKIILSNVVKMLSSRIYIDNEGEKHFLIDVGTKPKSQSNRGDNTFTIKALNNDKYAIKIIFQKITATGKQSVVSEFLKEYSDHRKIIIVRDYTGKIEKYIHNNNTSVSSANFPAQIFRESDFLSDKASYYEQPRYELLSPKEMEMVKQEYNITDYTANKMLRTDPMTKYFALKKGDIVRIIRPSETSGEAINYRVVS